jgi:xylose isomerase
MTETNRIDAVVDTLAGATKAVTNSYYNAFFSPEASERYQTWGESIGNGIVNTIERFELEEPVRNLYNRFRSEDGEEVETEE